MKPEFYGNKYFIDEIQNPQITFQVKTVDTGHATDTSLMMGASIRSFIRSTH